MYVLKIESFSPQTFCRIWYIICQYTVQCLHEGIISLFDALTYVALIVTSNECIK